MIKLRNFKINYKPSMYETNLLLDQVMQQNEGEVLDQHLVRKLLNPKKKDVLFH